MASKSLRRYDVQAKVSLYISLVACVGFVGLAALLVREYKPELQAIVYRKAGPVEPVFLLGTAATMLLSAVGLAMGFSSAGQRRNTMQRRSWIAFFMGTAALAGAIICLALFWFLRMRLK